MFSEVELAIPPLIADLNYRPSGATALAIDDATRAVTSLDRGPGVRMAALAGFLLRSESVSSSRIEQVNATRDDFAKAVAGSKASDAARSTLAAVEALERMVSLAGRDSRISLDDLLAAHRTLLQDDHHEREYAGKFRDMQNWIGGSDYSPRGAVHVPPPPEMVPALIGDLLAYSNRADVLTIPQAALVHAQFESIHPFTDGNGRIGRALLSAVIRRRKLAERCVVPIASAMLADVNRYFELVNNYRQGAADEFVHYVATSATVAAEAAEVSAAELAKLPELWRDLARPRKGSADEKIIDILLDRPALDVNTAVALTGVSYRGANDAMSRLEEAGVLSPLTSRAARDRSWVAGEVLDEIDRMNARIGTRLPAG